MFPIQYYPTPQLLLGRRRKRLDESHEDTFDTSYTSQQLLPLKKRPRRTIANSSSSVNTTTSGFIPSQTEKKEKKSKCVSFSDTMKISTLHRTREDMDKAWYSPVDYARFKYDVYSTIKAIQVQTRGGDIFAINNNNNNNTCYCIRGLEKQISSLMFREPSNSRIIRLQVLAFLNAAVSSQDVGFYYSLLSRQNRMHALKLAAMNQTTMNDR